MKKNTSQKFLAFSLVELSIVLIIIGLLVTGVSAGSSLINQAKLRTIVNEAEKYKINLNEYILTYEYLPGDDPNAHNYFGSSCDSTASKCNGNGDGRIIWTGGTDDNESLRGWQHLQLSEILSGSWDGVSSVNNSAVVDNDYPSSKAKAAGYTLHYWSGTQINVINVGGTLTPDTTRTLHSAFLYTKELYIIDKKFDDNGARTGFIVAARESGSGSDSCWNDSDQLFDLDSSDIECYAHFVFKKE